MTEEFEAWKATCAERWLERVRRARGSYMVALGVLEEAEADAEGVMGVDYSRSAVSASGGVSRVESAIARADAARKAVSTRKAEWEHLRDDASSRIARMPDPALAALLFERFIRCREWDDAGARLGWSHDQTMRRRRKALAMAFGVMPVEFRPPLHTAL